MKMQKRGYASKHSEKYYSSKEPCKMSKEHQCTIFCRKRRMEYIHIRFPLRSCHAEQKRQEYEAEKTDSENVKTAGPGRR